MDTMTTPTVFGDSGIIILLLFFLFMGQNGWGGNNRQTATTDDVFAATTQQSNATALNDIKNAIGTSTYEINSQMQNGFNSVNSNISDLSHQLSSCCCDMKQMIMQNRYDDVQNQLNLAQIASANAVQTQNILGQLGRFYTNPPYPYYAQSNGYFTGTTFA